MENESNGHTQPGQYESNTHNESPQDTKMEHVADSSEAGESLEQNIIANQTIHNAAAPCVASQQSSEASFNVIPHHMPHNHTVENHRTEEFIQNVTSAEEFIQRFKNSLPSLADSRLHLPPEAVQAISNTTSNLYPYLDPNVQRGLSANVPLQPPGPQLDDYRSKLDMINAGLFVRSSAPPPSNVHFEIPQLVKQTTPIPDPDVGKSIDSHDPAVQRKDSPPDLTQPEVQSTPIVAETHRENPYLSHVAGVGGVSEAAVAYAAQAVVAALAQQEVSFAASAQPVHTPHAPPQYTEHYATHTPVTHADPPQPHLDNVSSRINTSSEPNESYVNRESENQEQLPSHYVQETEAASDTHLAAHGSMKTLSSNELKRDASVTSSDSQHHDFHQQNIDSEAKDNGDIAKTVDLTETPDTETIEHTEPKEEQPETDQNETKVETGDVETSENVKVKDETDDTAIPRVTRSRSGRAKSTPVKKWSNTCKCCENIFKNEDEFNHHVVVNLGKNESLLVYKCLVCCQCFDAMADLHAHAQIHKEGMQCMICDQPFKTRVELELHLATHNCGPDADDVLAPDNMDTSIADNANNVSTAEVNGYDSDATIENDVNDDVALDDVDDDDDDTEVAGNGDVISGSGSLLDDPREILKHINLDLKQEPSSGNDDVEKDPSYRSSKRKKGGKMARFKCKYCGKQYRGQGCLKNHLRKCTAERPALTCKYCSKTFQDETNWKRHEGMHLGIRPHKCPHCDKAYSKKSHLTIHMQSHEGGDKQKPFQCEQCDKSFWDAHNLKRHQMRHTDEKPYPCGTCDKRFNDKGDLTMHEKYHLDERPHKCPHCDKAYVKRSHLVQHMAVHSGERKHQCQYCDRAYHSAQACKRHEMSHTGEKPYKCAFCDEAFVESADRKHHEMAQHKGERPHQCPHCDKTFVRKGHLTTHLLSHKGERSHKCDQCDKSFTTPYGLKKHRLIHSGEKNLACEFCGKMFRESRNLKVHLMTHTGEKPHGCNLCDKRFITAGELKMHMRVHTGEKPNTCEFCGMVFSQKGNLQRHLLRHTGERPLKCEICGKGFIEKQELNAHILNHNGLKPFKCEHCGLGFTRKHHLKKHYRTHTGYKPHACEFCGKTFSERYNLQTHRVIHTGVKPHPCPFCSVGFIRKGHLIKHVKEAHPGQELDDTPKFYIERGPNVPIPPNLPAILNVKTQPLENPQQPQNPQQPNPHVDESLEPMGASSTANAGDSSSNDPTHPLPPAHTPAHAQHPPAPQTHAQHHHAPTPTFEKQAEEARAIDNQSVGGMPAQTGAPATPSLPTTSAYQQESPYRRPYLPEVELPHAYPQLHPSLMQQYGAANMAATANMLNMNAATQENLINHMNRLSEMHPGAFPNPNMFPL